MEVTKPKPHKNLEAWKLGFEFAKEAYSVTRRFPDEERFGMISQIRRASVSIASNIAEGAARNTKKEFVNFLYISLGSVSELDTLILLSKELGYISSEKEVFLLNKLDIISKLIVGLIKKLKSDL